MIYGGGGWEMQRPNEVVDGVGGWWTGTVMGMLGEGCVVRVDRWPGWVGGEGRQELVWPVGTVIQSSTFWNVQIGTKRTNRKERTGEVLARLAYSSLTPSPFLATQQTRPFSPSLTLTLSRLFSYLIFLLSYVIFVGAITLSSSNIKTTFQLCCKMADIMSQHVISVTPNS